MPILIKIVGIRMEKRLTAFPFCILVFLLIKIVGTLLCNILVAALPILISAMPILIKIEGIRMEKRLTAFPFCILVFLLIKIDIITYWNANFYSIVRFFTAIKYSILEIKIKC